MPDRYLLSAQHGLTEDGLVIDINTSGGGVHSGSPLQALVKKSEANQWWQWAVPTIHVTVGENEFSISGKGFVPGTTAKGTSTYHGPIGTVNGGPYSLTVDSDGTITAYGLPLSGLEFNTPGSLTVQVAEPGGLSAVSTAAVPASA